MKGLKLYKIKEDYINFLRQYDSENVKYNKNEKRIYIGIVLIINNIKYFAPLASPKPKHKTMKENIDFIKINNGVDGVINLNNMIPVLDETIIKFDITNEEKIGYRNILFNQLKFIKRNTVSITEKAQDLYDKVTIYNSYIAKRCVDFKLLESVMGFYKAYQEVAVTVQKDIK